MIFRRGCLSAALLALLWPAAGHVAPGPVAKERPAPAAYETLSGAAVAKVVGEMPVLRFFRFFAAPEDQAPSRQHAIFYVSTLDIVPLAPFYYVAVHRQTQKAWLLNHKDISHFNRFALAEKIQVHLPGERERLAKLFLQYHVTGQDYLDQPDAPTLRAAAAKFPNLEKKATFYRRQDGGGRMIFYSYETGGTTRRWELSVSPQGQIQAARQEAIASPPTPPPASAPAPQRP